MFFFKYILQLFTDSIWIILICIILIENMDKNWNSGIVTDEW